MIQSWLLGVNLQEAGKIRLALAGAQPISGPGPVLDMNFYAPAPDVRTALTSSATQINEGTISYEYVPLENAVTLADAIIALQIMAGMNPAGQAFSNVTDVNNDGKIGLEEVIYILQKISDLRP
jgi:hypothetical protein